jgi:putative transposase
MLLVEQHIVSRTHPDWPALDQAAFASKNLYNAANYLLRQHFFKTDKLIRYATLAKQMKDSPDYRALPRKVSQQVLMQVDHDWRAFLAANEACRQEPAKFSGRPRLPKYKHKTEGRNLITYTLQALSIRALRRGYVQPSGLAVEFQTQHPKVHQVRVVPCATHYAVEVVYDKAVAVAPNLNPAWYAGMDLGLDNLAAVTSNKPGFAPFLVNGRPLKATNQYYNKRRAELQARLTPGQTSKRLERLTLKRNRRIQAELHLASRRILACLVREGIRTLVIGKNKAWKQEIELGKRTNQNFVNLPHARFIDMLRYKAELVGIEVVTREEAYTSKCSFLDAEPIEKHAQYAGRRVHRGLFVSATGRRIQADVNGAYNILRKEVPCAFTAAGIEGAVVRPVRFALAKPEMSRGHT